MTKTTKELVLKRQLQKPAADERSEWLQESSYRAGASVGFNLGVSEDHEGLEQLKKAHEYPRPVEHSQPAAPVELPVVAWMIEWPNHAPSLTTDKSDFPFDQNSLIPLVKLSDAQAAIAASNK